MQRTTRQRLAIQRAIEAVGRPILAEEVLAAATVQVPRLGIATVYRTLKALVENGRVEAVELAGQPTRYELAGKGHHAHFWCNACERVFEIEDCPVKAVRAPGGFVVKSHEVILRGTCCDCSRPKRRGAR